MPKPASVPPAWASSGNYAASNYPNFFPWPDELGAPGREPHPQAGNPTSWGGTARRIVSGLAAFANAGITPGSPLQGQLLNEWLAQMQDWTAWVDEGSSAAGLTAHLVETDSTGEGHVAGLELGGTAAAFAALDVSANSGASSAAAIFANTLGGAAISASSNGVTEPIRSTSTGAAAAILGSNVGGGGAGLKGLGNGAGPGVDGAGGASGHGADFLGGATSGHGVRGESTSNANAGVQGHGSSTVTHTGWGVRGFAGLATGGGVTGVQVFSGADPTDSDESAVFGQATDATALFGRSVDGYGVWAETDTTTPIRAALHLVPQDDDPSTPLEGDVYYNSATDQLKAYIQSRFQGIWATQQGFAYGFKQKDGSQTSISSTFASVENVVLASPHDPKESGGLATITVTFEMASAVAGSTFEWRLEDTTAGSVFPIAARTERAFQASSAADERYVVAKTQYLIPASGSRNFDLQLRSTDNVTAARIRRVTLEVSGTYE